MDVVAWLRDLGLAECVDAFRANGVDAAMLSELNNEDLKDLGVTRLVDRKRLLKAIQQLPQEIATAELVASTEVILSDERRQVTVLFADLVGYTHLTSTLGAEDVHTILNRYFEMVDAIVQSYGGSVNKHIGDSVMAVFGAPVAHEDDCMRAISAAFQIHERMAVLSRACDRLLQVHIGIASGQVVAGSTGSDTHREYTVTGEAVNLAARLQDKARPGETLISGVLRRAIGHRVFCDPLGKIGVKGVDELVDVWRAKALLQEATPSARVAFVGRRIELAQFKNCVETCRTSKQGQTVIVRGEAGIGKSRLVEEFTRLAMDQGFLTHKGLVLDFGVGEGRDAIRSVVASFLGIHLGQAKATHHAAAEAAVSEGLLSASQKTFLADLLNLPQSVESRAIYDAMHNAARNEGKHKLVCDLLRHASMSNPILVVIEDIHWADPATLLYLSRMAATVAEIPALLIMTSRIEGYPLGQDWRSGIGGCPLTTFDLAPLRKVEAVSLASGFMDTSSQLAVNCVERAAGNPLFLEHLLRNLEEQGGEEVPASIQSLVSARIDRLPLADKQALQAASVLGQRFSLEALRQLTKNTHYTCEILVQRHLLRPESDEYLFTHALLREGVYNSLLKARLTDLHRDAAEWYKRRDLALYAEHLDRAIDPAAAPAYLKAAKAQMATFHFETALRLADRGIALAADSSTRCELMCLRGDALRDIGATDESINVFEGALASADDDVHRCQAWIGMAAGLRVADRHKAALEVLHLAEAAAIGRGLISERVQIHYIRGNVYFPLGNADGCLGEHEKALVFARRAGSTEGEALALGGLGDAYYLRGHMRSACEQFRACIAVCREHGYVRIEVANRHMVGWTRIHLMEHAGAIDDALEAMKMAAMVSHRRANLLGLMLAGAVELEFGNLTKAQAHLHHALELARTISAGNLEANALVTLAQVSAAQGNVAEARNFAELAVKIVREIGMTFIGPAALAIRAALIERGDKSKELLMEAESILGSGCVAHNHFWFAKIAINHALAVGDWDEAERHAGQLEFYTREQPLPWSKFVIARGRALAAWGRGSRHENLKVELSRLQELADRHGLRPVASEFKRALAAA